MVISVSRSSPGGFLNVMALNHRLPRSCLLLVVLGMLWAAGAISEYAYTAGVNDELSAAAKNYYQG
jgi:hypothetical protein